MTTKQTGSSQTTGGDEVSGVDPGGTRPTHGRKDAPAKTTHKVESGDRNAKTSSEMTPKD